MFHVVRPNVPLWETVSERILGKRQGAGTERLGDAIISYLSPLLAIIVGIVHAALAPVIVVGGVKPNLVLVAVVLVTVLFGLLPGITWAFVAGLTANLLVGDPLGSVPLAMLLVAVLVAGGARILGRVGWVYPIAATFAGSIVADLVSLGISQLVTDAAPTAIPLDLLLAAATLNAVMAGLLLYPVRLIAARYVSDEAPAW
jgi:rod shape-determining protein MreD